MKSSIHTAVPAEPQNGLSSLSSKKAAAAKLRRLLWNENGLERFLRIRLKQFGELLPHFFCIHVSHDDEC